MEFIYLTTCNLFMFSKNISIIPFHRRIEYLFNKNQTVPEQAGTTSMLFRNTFPT